MSTPTTALLLVGTMDLPRVQGLVREVGLAPDVLLDPELLVPGRRALAIVDPDVLDDTDGGSLAALVQRLPDTPLVVLSGAVARRQLAHYVGLPTLRAVVARDHVSSDDELAMAVRALHRGPSFGWAGLVEATAPTFERPIAGSADRDACLHALADFASMNRVRRRIVAILQDVADELITNAVYDAPVDAGGRPLYASRDRRQPVELSPEQRPVLLAAKDGSRVAVAVRDPFGALSLDTARGFLAKGLGGGSDQISDKAGGAGLGLTRIYERVDRLALKVKRGRATEVVAIIELGGARKDMASRPSSLLLVSQS